LRAVIQRVMQGAKVEVLGKTIGHIDKGLLVFLGIGTEDTDDDIRWLTKKIVGLRVFSDADDKMNLPINDIDGSLLVISQFTLLASTKKGNRPSYIKSAKPEISEPLYRSFIDHMKKEHEIHVEEGIFGADMKVQLVNDGPVTIIIDSKVKE